MKPSTKVSKEAQDSAQSYAEEIKRYHQKIITAQRECYQDTLAYAIKAGKALILAKENVKAVNGKWLEWLKKIELPQTTSNLYVRLAENEEFLQSERMKKALDGAGEGLSIRATVALLPKRARSPSPGKASASTASNDEDEDQDDEQEDEDEEEDASDDSSDLPSMLKDAGVDGTIDAITEPFLDTEDLRKIIYDLT